MINHGGHRERLRELAQVSVRLVELARGGKYCEQVVILQKKSLRA